MNRITPALMITAALLMPMRPVAQDRSDVALRAAMETETVKGDLRGAIEQYRRIAAQARDRGMAATALVRMAECYQKLGDKQAAPIYERVLREYSDQKDAVTIARSHLDGSVRSVAAKGDRAVWTGRDVDLFGTVSPDGRYLTYVDWGGNVNLMVRDLVTGASQKLTNNSKPGEFGSAQWSAISRDGARLAYEWFAPDRIDELRIADMAGLKISAARTVKRLGEGEFVRPFDWSPDGRSLAVLIERADRSSQVGTLSLQDGSTRMLKSIDWRGVEKMVFSPDGRFIAYDIIPAGARDRSHIDVIAVDASGESAIVEDSSKNHLMGWSPDGYLVFTSDRTGTNALWTVPVENGRAKQPPTLVKEHVGSTRSLGLTPSGTLFVWQHASAEFVKVASFDVESGRLADGGAGDFQRFIESRGRPNWSPDGKHLLFESCGPSGGGPCALFDRSTDTGVVREIPHTLGYLGFPQLSPDGRSILTSGTDLKGRKGAYLIDVATGRTTLVNTVANADPLQWSSDGHAIRYIVRRGSGVALVEQALGGTESKEIFRTSTADRFVRLSPDGRFAGLVRRDGDVKTFVIASVANGASHVAFRPPTGSIFDPWWQWTHDGQAAIVMTRVDGGEELWRVNLNGQSTKLAIDGHRWGEGFSIDSEGRHIAFVAQAGAPGDEVWALENFLPAAGAKKP
jgi:Tol biopolymer transport system component